jgi:tellurite resistance protein TerC
MMRREHRPVTYRWARRIAVALLGGTVLAIGFALIVLPGPAFVVIPIGLAILGAEFAWARRWLRRVKKGSADLVSYFRNDDK